MGTAVAHPTHLTDTRPLALNRQAFVSQRAKLVVMNFDEGCEFRSIGCGLCGGIVLSKDSIEELRNGVCDREEEAKHEFHQLCHSRSYHNLLRSCKNGSWNDLAKN